MSPLLYPLHYGAGSFPVVDFAKYEIVPEGGAGEACWCQLWQLSQLLVDDVKAAVLTVVPVQVQ